MPAIDLPAAEPPLYQLIQPRSAQVLGPAWARSFPEHSEVVGYSSLGHVFMQTCLARYLVLHPLKGAAKSYGSYRSLAAFERGVLQDPALPPLCCVRTMCEWWPVGWGRWLRNPCTSPPLSFLGGSDAPDSYEQGNVWVFVQTVARLSGL